jgi:hypothetical protein
VTDIGVRVSQVLKPSPFHEELAVSFTHAL